MDCSKNAPVLLPLLLEAITNLCGMTNMEEFYIAQDALVSQKAVTTVHLAGPLCSYPYKTLILATAL